MIELVILLREERVHHLHLRQHRLPQIRIPPLRILHHQPHPPHPIPHPDHQRPPSPFLSLTPAIPTHPPLHHIQFTTQALHRPRRSPNTKRITSHCIRNRRQPSRQYAHIHHRDPLRRQQIRITPQPLPHRHKV
ncbi:hypothetical protein K458DRAFT_417866 [Lentithecium fluviatile CBS 122367]|uniref:Uncharacterized protein n=1 Tax=Lentithecium fluviatile CBS 122367 TaxID=1168545 RepID=A0A6G1J220_9PLEO|nr:hypothetical protein K458DRAFT_417866 [Lentithecium fluviatile CBS 122367]